MSEKYNLWKRERYRVDKLDPEWVLKHNAKRRCYRDKSRSKLLVLLGDKCVRCGFTDKRALQIDHIDNDGYIERRQYKDYRDIYKNYYNNPKLAKQKIQILCSNCNWIKKHEKETKDYENKLREYQEKYK